MNVKKLMINTLIMAALALSPVGLSSCSDDDDGGNGNGGGNIEDPNISENSARLYLSGDASDTIASTTDPNVRDTAGTVSSGETRSSVTIYWSDQNKNTATIIISESGGGGAETGTYQPLSIEDATSGGLPEKASQIEVTLNGTLWINGSNGSVEFSTNNSNKVAGTINDVTLSKNSSSDDSTITVNGAFNAQK